MTLRPMPSSAFDLGEGGTVCVSQGTVGRRTVENFYCDQHFDGKRPGISIRWGSILEVQDVCQMPALGVDSRGLRRAGGWRLQPIWCGTLPTPPG